MDMIFKSIGTLCLIVYSVGIVNSLLPDGYAEKAIRLTVIVCIANTMVLSIKNIDFNIQSDIYNIEEQTDTAENLVLLEAKKSIESRIRKTLDENNISYNSLDVHINKQSEGIRIEKVCISGVSQEQRDITGEILNTDCKIVFGD